MPTGNAGVLYPPKCFHSDVLNSKVFMKLCPSTDDIWFKVMSLLNEVPCQKADRPSNYHEISVDKTDGLNSINNAKVNINDISLRRLIIEYPVHEILNKINDK